MSPSRPTFWITMSIDLLRSAVKENWQSCLRLMNPKSNGEPPIYSFVRIHPFGTGGWVLSLACIVGLGWLLRVHDFTEAAYFMVMVQVSILAAMILFSGLLVDVHTMFNRRSLPEFLISTLILCFIGFVFLVLAIYQVQNFELVIEEMLPLILNIVIGGTMLFQLAMLNDIRVLFRMIREQEAAAGDSEVEPLANL